MAIDIANNYIANWIKSTPADIVMFMLGTNDVTRGHTTAEITAAYTKIVQTVRANNPKAKFIVSIPRISFLWWWFYQNSVSNNMLTPVIG